MSNNQQMVSIHGETAAKRQAVTELLFFASVGDLYRCKKIVHAWSLQVKDTGTADYDRRTPLHLSAAEGAYSVVNWLIKQGVEVNPVDRFKRTPLEEAVRGDHGEVVTLLVSCGGKVVNKAGELVDLAESPLAGNVRIFTDYDPEWEIDPNDLTLQEMIGEGEFGVVHRARWHGTAVAVKILKQTGAVALGDFRTELNVLQKVVHPYTVQFLGAVTKYEPYMIVSEYMTGGSLADVFKDGGRLSIWRAVQVALDCAKGLAYLHNCNPHTVIHRDLKPANLLLGGPKVYSSHHKQMLYDEYGVLKIADFGLSKSLKMAKSKTVPGEGSVSVNGHNRPKASEETSVRRSGPSVSYKLTGETGSYRYMAPEVFRHEPYNNKVDVYSFAMIVYQLLSGSPPFQGIDPVEAARQAALANIRPEWPATNLQGEVIPEKAKKLVESCWAADYDERPEMVDVIDILSAVGRELKPKLADGPPKAKERGGGGGAASGPVPESECCSVQ